MFLIWLKKYNSGDRHKSTNCLFAVAVFWALVWQVLHGA